MNTLAAVLEKIGAPLKIRTLEVPAPGAGQVLVKIRAAGVCHSQLSEIAGERGEDKYLPHLLGHEASGEVLEAGKGVKKVKRGDAVVLTWIQGKGKSPGGVKYKGVGGTVNAGAIAVFSEYAVVNESRVVPIRGRVDWAEAALFGCAVPTGAGAVINTLKVKPGSSIAVLGTGGVGLCAIMAAKMAGAEDIIAVDVLSGKLKAAAEAGATWLINPGKENLVEEIKRKYPRGIEYAVAAVGAARVIEQAFEVISDQGKLVVVGHPPYGQKISIEPHALIRGKQITGSWGGGGLPDKDIPRYYEWYVKGKLPVSMLIGKKYKIQNINQAISDLKRGKSIRPIIIF